MSIQTRVYEIYSSENEDKEITGLEAMTVEEKRPREGRPARYFEAPQAVGFESTSGTEETPMRPKNPTTIFHPDERERERGERESK